MGGVMSYTSIESCWIMSYRETEQGRAGEKEVATSYEVAYSPQLAGSLNC